MREKRKKGGGKRQDNIQSEKKQVIETQEDGTNLIRNKDDHSYLREWRLVPNGNIKSVERGQENDFPLMVFWSSQSKNGCNPLVDIR
jgi:hypothetical protein